MYLKDGEVLENAVHHVLFWQVLQFVDEIDHVLAHGWTTDAINEPTVFEPGVLCLHFLYHLFSEGAHFRRTRYRHVLVALVSKHDNKQTAVAYITCQRLI